MSLSTHSKPSTEGTNLPLQGLRGLCALTVLLVHVHFMAAKVGLIQIWPGRWVHDVGPFAVMLFFCISGYLIVRTLVRHGSVKRFLWNRVARIYPVFLLLHLIMFFFGPWMGYEWMGELRGDFFAWCGHFMANALFLPGLIDLPIAQKNAWSLSFEAAFYLLAALFFTASASQTVWKKSGLSLLALFGVTLFLVRDFKAIFFAVGVATWYFESRNRVPILFSRGVFPWLGLAFGAWAYHREQLLASALAVLPFFTSVVLQQGSVASLLKQRWFVWLGKISYSLYLLHPFVLEVLRRLSVKALDFSSSSLVLWCFLLLGTISAILASSVCYLWVEVWLTRWLFYYRKSENNRA